MRKKLTLTPHRLRDPKLLSWFGSVEGQRMVQEGTLVETYQYLERRRVPPASPEARASVADQARENARRLQVIREREALGYGVATEDQEWARWYEELRERLVGLVEEIRTEKKGTAA